MSQRPDFVDELRNELARASHDDQRDRASLVVVGAVILIAFGLVAALAFDRSANDVVTSPAVTGNQEEASSNAEDESSADDDALSDDALSDEAPSDEAPSDDEDPALLVDLPADARVGHTLIWTGTEALLWGGWNDESGSRSFDDGFGFDPESNVWGSIAPAPLEGRAHHAAAWTGSEMLILGGFSGDNRILIDGAAYNPDTESWRAIQPSPYEPTPTLWPSLSSVWTGTELVIWYRHDDYLGAYNPQTDTWRILPSTNLSDVHHRISGALRWDGERLVALLGESPNPLRGVTLSNNDEVWNKLAPVPRADDTSLPDPFPANSGVFDGTLYVWPRSGRYGITASLASGATEWAIGTPIPLAACEGHFEPLVSEGVLAVWEACGSDQEAGTIVYLSPDGTWTRRPVSSGTPFDSPSAVWTGSEILAVTTTCCFGQPGSEQWSAARYPIPALGQHTSR